MCSIEAYGPVPAVRKIPGVEQTVLMRTLCAGQPTRSHHEAQWEALPASNTSNGRVLWIRVSQGGAASLSPRSTSPIEAATATRGCLRAYRGPQRHNKYEQRC